MTKRMDLLTTLAFTAVLVSNNQLLAQPEYDVPSGPDKFARIVYPAANCLDPVEGTCELWVRNDFDPSVRLANAFYVPMCFFRVQEEGSRDEKMYLLTRSVKNGRDVGFRVGQAVDFVGLDKFGWRERNEWHHLALTWVGDRQRYTLRLYQDGQRIDQVTDNQSAPLRIGAKTEIVVDSPVFACSFATVDELRISAIQRSPDEIARQLARTRAGLPGTVGRCCWTTSTGLNLMRHVRTLPGRRPKAALQVNPAASEPQDRRYYAACRDYGLDFSHLYIQMEGQFGAPRTSSPDQLCGCSTWRRSGRNTA